MTGGTFGLLGGLSLIGAIEIMYWCLKMFSKKTVLVKEGVHGRFRRVKDFALATTVHGPKYVVMVIASS